MMIAMFESIATAGQTIKGGRMVGEGVSSGFASLWRTEPVRNAAAAVVDVFGECLWGTGMVASDGGPRRRKEHL